MSTDTTKASKPSPASPMPTSQSVRAELDANPERLDELIGKIDEYNRVVAAAELHLPDDGLSPRLLHAFAQLTEAINADSAERYAIRTETRRLTVSRPATREELTVR